MVEKCHNSEPEPIVQSRHFDAAQLADLADTAAKGSRVVAGVAVVGAAIAAPTGLASVGVALGLVSAPFIVTAAPVIVAVAGGAATVSAAASLYVKARRRRRT